MMHRIFPRLGVLGFDWAGRRGFKVFATTFHHGARGIVVALILALSMASVSRAAPAKTVAFKVDAQPLTIALMILAQQAGVEVRFSYEELKGLQAPEIAGKLTPEQAFERILSGTPYTALRQRAKSFQVMSPQSVAKATAEAERTGVPLVKYVEVPPRPLPPLPEREASVDRPRTPDDVLPYVVFDGAKVEQSGALTVGDFLAERLPASSGPSHSGDVGLRGMGERYTRVMVNGRDVVDSSSFPTIDSGLTYRTSKLSSVPLSSIKRIEVIPQSTSGYFGGAAVGGAINVVTKRDYTGGEITVGYDNSFDTDSANRKAELRYGTSFNGGRTKIMLFAGANDSNALAVQDRYDLIRDYASRATTGATGLLNGADVLFGTTPRIDTSDGSSLVLKSGQTLGSTFIYLPSGYRGVGVDGTAPLVSNVGKLPTPPANAEDFLGRSLLLHRRPNTDSLRTEIRQALNPSIEAFLDFSYEKRFRKDSTSLYSSDAYLTVPVGVATNPFGQEVRVRFPYRAASPHESSRWRREMTAGFLFSLPREWTARLEHTRTYNSTADRIESADPAGLQTAVNAGTLNVFQDSSQFPDLLSNYTSTRTGVGAINSVESLLRAEGDLPEFFSIQPTLTVGARWRKVGRDRFEIHDSKAATTSGILPASQSSSSVFAELTLPLIPSERARTGLRMLEVVAAGRREKYDLDSTIVKATGSQTVPNIASLPVLEKVRANYLSSNPVFGVRFKPVEDVMLRGSFSTGFLPNADYELLPHFTATGSIIDPKRGNTQTQASIVTGGNTSLDPEKSESISTGIVFTPQMLPGFRVSVDYTTIKKEGAVDILDKQTILAYESVLAGRVTRGPVPGGDTYGVGPITKVDASAINLYDANVAAWDVSVGYKRDILNLGAVDLSALYTVQSKFEQQVVPGGPLVDFVNAPRYSGPVRDRASASVVWSRGSFGAGWTTRYRGAYKQANTAQAITGTSLPDPTGFGASARVYHDAFLRYRVIANGSPLNGWLGGTEVVFGVRNLFNAEPLFDANLPSELLLSGDGDLRRQSYYLSLKREF